MGLTLRKKERNRVRLNAYFYKTKLGIILAVHKDHTDFGKEVWRK